MPNNHMPKQHFASKIDHRPLASIIPSDRNARRHSKQQIKQIARSIQSFGFTNPILVDDEGKILAGHGRLAAAKHLGLEIVPVIPLSHLTAQERRAYRLADNKIALNAQWDKDMLATELQGLVDLDFDIGLTGFSITEVDVVIEEAKQRKLDLVDRPEDQVAPLPAVATCTNGDLWQLGHHKLICGDARDDAVFAALLLFEKVDLIFTDPPIM